MKATVLFVLFCLSLCDYLSGQIITTVAGNGVMSYSGDGGPATNASIGGAGSITFDSHNNYYFSELNNTIRKVSNAGIISVYAGNGTAGFSGDGGAATEAQFNFTGGGGIAFDNSGNLYIADQANNRVRKIDHLSGIVTSVVGNGTAGFSGDGGSAIVASLNSPAIVDFDLIGNMYFIDALNFRIRKVTTLGIISTIAGNGTIGYTGDGYAATNASISNYGGFCIDNSTESLYFCDGIRIRKVDLNTGIISTIAGNGGTGFAGDGGPATDAMFYGTQDVKKDKGGNLYISDVSNNRVRKINSSGIVSTFAGNGGTGFSGDGAEAVSAEIYSPRGIALDTCDNLYIVDNGNKRIRKIWINPTCTGVAVPDLVGTKNRFNLAPNPATTHITITTTEKINTITITNMLGQSMHSQVCNGIKEARIDIAHLLPGMYLVRVNDVWVQRFMKE